jgi:hypothetical protein
LLLPISSISTQKSNQGLLFSFILVFFSVTIQVFPPLIMFSLFNGIYDSYLAPTQLNLLIVGPPIAGKSALLERLKVTDIPTSTRPRRSTSSLSSDNISNSHHLGKVEDLTNTLYTAFVATGAADIAGRRKSSILALTGGGRNNNNSRSISPKRNPSTPEEVNRQFAAAEEETTNEAATALSSNQLTVTKPKRRFFRLNICPAPERYMQSAQDQDDDFEESDHQAEQKELLLAFQDAASTTNEYNDSFSDPPQRVRCHSKEFNVDSLDLMDGRRSSMQDIPLENSCTKKISTSITSKNVDEYPTRSSRQSPLPRVQGPKLLQSSSEELYVKPNAKMLSLMKIRPTSKCAV